MKSMKLLLIGLICFICYSSILTNRNLSKAIALQLSPDVASNAPFLTGLPTSTSTNRIDSTAAHTKQSTPTPSVIKKVSAAPITTALTTKISTPVPFTKKPTAIPEKTAAPKAVSYALIPKTPGTITYTNDENTAVIDASNVSQGYLAVKYSGKNKKVKVQISYGDTTYNYDLPSNNTYTFFPLQFGNGTYKIGIFENISDTTYMPILKNDISVTLKNDNDVFLYPNQYVWFTPSSSAVTKAANLCAGLDNDIKKISAIFNYIVTNISYDYNKADTVASGYLPDVDSVLKQKTGICFDYASLFAAMCRCQDIPAKLVTGYVSSGTYHAWNEVYTKETGWVTVYIFLDKTGFNRLDPTFYSNMDKKEEAASYIGNGSNYQNYHFY